MEAKNGHLLVTLVVNLDCSTFLQGIQKCGRSYTLDTFRGNEGPKCRFLGGPEGSKSMAGAIL